MKTNMRSMTSTVKSMMLAASALALFTAGTARADILFLFNLPGGFADGGVTSASSYNNGVLTTDPTLPSTPSYWQQGNGYVALGLNSNPISSFNLTGSSYNPNTISDSLFNRATAAAFYTTETFTPTVGEYLQFTWQATTYNPNILKSQVGYFQGSTYSEVTGQPVDPVHGYPLGQTLAGALATTDGVTDPIAMATDATEYSSGWTQAVDGNSVPYYYAQGAVNSIYLTAGVPFSFYVSTPYFNGNISDPSPEAVYSLADYDPNGSGGAFGDAATLYITGMTLSPLYDGVPTDVFSNHAVPEPSQIAASLVLLAGIVGFHLINRRRLSSVA